MPDDTQREPEDRQERDKPEKARPVRAWRAFRLRGSKTVEVTTTAYERRGRR